MHGDEARAHVNGRAGKHGPKAALFWPQTRPKWHLGRDFWSFIAPSERVVRRIPRMRLRLDHGKARRDIRWTW